MPLPEDITTAITEAAESKTANDAVIVGLVGVADETNMTAVRAFAEPGTSPETFDVRVTVSLRSLGVSKAIADDLIELFALTRGTR